MEEGYALEPPFTVVPSLNTLAATSPGDGGTCYVPNAHADEAKMTFTFDLWSHDKGKELSVSK